MQRHTKQRKDKTIQAKISNAKQLKTTPRNVKPSQYDTGKSER